MRAGSYGGCGKIRILASRGPGARWGSSASRSGASCTVSADAHGSLRPEPILPEILGTVRAALSPTSHSPALGQFHSNSISIKNGFFFLCQPKSASVACEYEPGLIRLGIEDLRSFGSTVLTNCPKLLVCEHSNAILIPLKTDLASCLGVGRIFIFIAAV